jgi:hypothetical protein
MIDPVETLIQARDVSEATFRDLIERLGPTGWRASCSMKACGHSAATRNVPSTA